MWWPVIRLHFVPLSVSHSKNFHYLNKTTTSLWQFHSIVAQLRFGSSINRHDERNWIASQLERVERMRDGREAEGLSMLLTVALLHFSMVEQEYRISKWTWECFQLLCRTTRRASKASFLAEQVAKNFNLDSSNFIVESLSPCLCIPFHWFLILSLFHKKANGIKTFFGRSKWSINLRIEENEMSF